MPKRRTSPAVAIDVRALRQKMGLSQTDLVEKLYGERNRVHKRTIRAWETRTQKPSLIAQQNLKRIQQEFEAENKTKGTTEGTGATRVKGTRVPSEPAPEAVSSNRPVSHLAPGITNTTTP